MLNFKHKIQRKVCSAMLSLNIYIYFKGEEIFMYMLYEKYEYSVNI